MLLPIETKQLCLFHSATGKDSIVLLDVLSKNYAVQPVFLYYIKGLEHIESYITWAEKKYQVKFDQVPHFILSNIIRDGLFGIKKDTKQKKFNFTQVSDNIRINTGIEWQVYGFKKSDGLNRCLMLKTLDKEMVNHSTRRIYPLVNWTNAQCLKYIEQNKLLPPLTYGIKARSNTMNFADPITLAVIKKRWPNDLKKIFEVFPECEIILWKHENQ